MQPGLIGAAGNHFSQVVRPALGSNRPQSVGQVFPTILRGRCEVFKARLDIGAAPLRLHGGIAFACGQQHRAAEINPGGAGAILVVDRLGGSGDYSDTVNWRAPRIPWRLLPTCERALQEEYGDAQYKY